MGGTEDAAGRRFAAASAEFELTEHTPEAAEAKPQGESNVFQSGEDLGVLSFVAQAE
jgi:hypothetical protein